ncbi:MAG: amidohydrolase family protein [Bacteroidales bacterium]|nr:amidohydrolase family protein [Bacteroidales bacterium]
MRRLSANYIIPVDKKPLKNGIVEIDDDGKIINLIDTGGDLTESQSLEFYNGVIVPGFINTHCHLELSGFKNKIPTQTGLPNFIKHVVDLKRNNKQIDFKAIELYDSLMRSNGIVAVGDICNTNDTLRTKNRSKIHYYNFIEAIGLGKASDIFKYNQELETQFKQEKFSTSIVPHAPYSVSQELFDLIKLEAQAKNTVLTIHNQESADENQMFVNKTGNLVNQLQAIGVDLKNWESSGKSSIHTIIDLLPRDNNILFVHNLFSSIDDLNTISRKIKNSFFCLCPLSNLYIQNKLPDLKLFLNYTNQITLGTDSMASNKSLSILDEIKALSLNFDYVRFVDSIKWATLNGAKALKIDDKFGSITKGKYPRLNLITNFDFEKMQVTGNSQVQVLI